MFLTGNDDPEMAREALGTGATGYVSKLDAAVELLNAVEAVLLGKQFVSKRLAGRRLTGDPNRQLATPRLRGGVSAITSSEGGASPKTPAKPRISGPHGAPLLPSRTRLPAALGP